MMPEEWPIAASAADRNAPARPAGSGRLATARTDFFLNPAGRLSEQERALMTAMLHCLVGELADAIRAALPAGWTAANDADNAALVEVLTRSRLADEPGLMALLLRRADEERIAGAARARSGRRDARMLQGLVSHENADVAAAAMALILGRGRRRDRFGQCLADVDDLPPASADALAHAVAAAMRREFATAANAALADAELTAAAARVLAGRDDQRSLDALTSALVRKLEESGALTDELVLASALEGEIALIGEVLARRAGVSSDTALDELLSGSPLRAMIVCRLGRCSHDLCAGMLAGIGDLLGIADSAEAIGVFDRVTDEQAAASRARLTTPPGYRAALDVLGMDNGQRPL